MAIDFNGSTDRIDYSNVINWSAQAQTVYFRISPDDVTLDSAYFFLNHASGDGAIAFICWTGSGGSTEAALQLNVKASTTDLVRVSDDDVLVNTTFQDVIMTWDGVITTQTSIHFYVDNVEVTYRTGTDGAGTPTAATGSLSLAGRIFDDNVNWDGRIASFGRWTRVITAGERAILQATHNPDFIPNGLIISAPLIRETADFRTAPASNIDGTSVVAHPSMLFPYTNDDLFVPAIIVAATRRQIIMFG